MWIDYGGVYFNDVDGNVYEKEEFDRDDDNFDDYYDDDSDDAAYIDDGFFDGEVIAMERLIDEAMERCANYEKNRET